MHLEKISQPARIVVDTTRRCNLSCWYCHSTSGPKYDGPSVTVPMIEDVFATADKNHIFDITLTGGETLMWEHLTEAMQATKALVYPSIALITNATVVTESRLKTLSSGKINRINVSLDGLSSEHDKNRGKGNFDRTIKGIKELISVVDNITVISVLDKNTAEHWQELTELLIKIGVKQHHLTPVCYSGNAREDYRGMSREQFLRVRAEVDEMQAKVPRDFKLRFGDTLINGFKSRELPIHLFVEGFKGWQVHLRPDGLVKGHTKVWGRNWRTDEVLGDLNTNTMSSILSGYSDKVGGDVESRFSLNEEASRKFHLTDEVGVVKSLDDNDMANHQNDGVNSHQRRDASEKIGASVADQLISGMDFDEESAFKAKLPDIIADPNRYRLRNELDFGLLFDTKTFDIIILTQQELNQLQNIIT